MEKESAVDIHPSLQPFLDEIADRLVSNHAAIMVGAGFSCNAIPNGRPNCQFPAWDELGDIFYAKLHRDENKNKAYLDPLRLASEVEAAFKRSTLDEIIRQRIPDKDYEPSPLHEKLLSLPWADVFTTNYDTLLERASKKISGRRYDIVVNVSELVYSKRPRIIKLHGSLPANPPFTITDEDYRQYPIHFAPFVNTVQQALIENTICLIGFSGDDPNFQHWIGWIRDNLREHAPRIFMIGVKPIPDAQRMLFEQRNIAYLDFSSCIESPKNSYKSCEFFFDYLLQECKKRKPILDDNYPIEGKEKKQEENKRVIRPESNIGIEQKVSVSQFSLLVEQGHITPKLADAKEKTPEIREIISLWRNERERYPGWLIAPQEQRDSIWRFTSEWLNVLNSREIFPEFLDFYFLYELNWRIEKCLYPLFDDTAKILKDCLARYWPFPEDNILNITPVDQVKSRLDTVRIAELYVEWITLALSLIRYYREEGKGEEWKVFKSILEKHRDLMNAEQLAAFTYENCLYCLFDVDLKNLDKELENWPKNTSLPFWESKRAGLLAELGKTDDAVKILNRSLSDIRSKQNLKSESSDFGFVSQEAYIMVLRKHVGFSLDWMHAAESTDKNLWVEFSERWNELQKYLCDPWQELKNFTTRLELDPHPREQVSIKHEFDIGSTSRTVRLGSTDTEALWGYSYLRFLEETGIPVVIPYASLGKKAAIGAVSRIAPYSLYWALSTASRIGDSEVANRLFDRFSLTKLNCRTIDELVTSYIMAAQRITETVEQRPELCQTSWGSYSANVIPEILSRLCCKSSAEVREKILVYLETLYRREKKPLHSGIRHLISRLVEATPFVQMNGFIPRFLSFERPDEEDFRNEREFINPMAIVIDSNYAHSKDAKSILVADEVIEKLLQDATSSAEKQRNWVITSLFTLFELDTLTDAQRSRFSALVWEKATEGILPEYGGIFRFPFLELLSPENVDARSLFKKYILGEKLPIVGEKKNGVTITYGDSPVLSEILGSAQYLEWSGPEIHELFHNLISWWDTDKHFLEGRNMHIDSVGIDSISDEVYARLRRLPMVLSRAVSKSLCSTITDNDKSEVTRFISECKTLGVPYLETSEAFSSLFPEKRPLVINEILDALSSSRDDDIIDALNALIFTLNPWAGDFLPQDKVALLLEQVGDLIRWRYEAGLVSALNTMHRFVVEKPDCLDDALEASVLSGLKELAHETDPTKLDALAIPPKLEIRKSAASLSFVLFRYYQSIPREIPQTLRLWEGICASENEFAEIRNQWY
jgi:hypothetical protein